MKTTGKLSGSRAIRGWLFGELVFLLAILLGGPVGAQDSESPPVQLHIDQIDSHLLASGDTRIDVTGRIANGSLVPLQQVQAVVRISGPPPQAPVEVRVPPVVSLEPLGTKTFGVSHTFSRQHILRPLIRTASLTYRPVHPLQIADWILGSAAQQLEKRRIPFDRRILSDLALRRETALKVLMAVPEGDKDYGEARRKRGQILVVWAQELIAAGNRRQANRLLRRVEADNPYAAEAQRLSR